jgi:hypothetical protein
MYKKTQSAVNGCSELTVVLLEVMICCLRQSRGKNISGFRILGVPGRQRRAFGAGGAQTRGSEGQADTRILEVAHTAAGRRPLNLRCKLDNIHKFAARGRERLWTIKFC